MAMISLAVLAGLLLVFLALAFFTKRRFGVLGLSLAAGYVLSTHWAGTLTPLIERQGLTLAEPPLGSVVAAGLIILPPLVLLLGGPVYTKVVVRLAGAFAFALLAIAFLLEPLGEAINFEGVGYDVYMVFSEFQSAIIVAGLIGAIIDVFLTRRRKDKDKKK